jgi:hypothetical protein
MLSNPASVAPAVLAVLREYFLGTLNPSGAARPAVALLAAFLARHSALDGSESAVVAFLARAATTPPAGLSKLLPLLSGLAVLPALPARTVAHLALIARTSRPSLPHSSPAAATPDLRLALLASPFCTEDIVLSLLEDSVDPAVFVAVASTLPWSASRTIQQAILLLDRVPEALLGPVVRAITAASDPALLVETFSDIHLAMAMQGRDPLPLLRIFLHSFTSDQAALVPPGSLAWLMSHQEADIRQLAASLALRHRKAITAGVSRSDWRTYWRSSGLLCIGRAIRLSAYSFSRAPKRRIQDVGNEHNSFFFGPDGL